MHLKLPTNTISSEAILCPYGGLYLDYLLVIRVVLVVLYRFNLY